MVKKTCVSCRTCVLADFKPLNKKDRLGTKIQQLYFLPNKWAHTNECGMKRILLDISPFNTFSTVVCNSNTSLLTCLTFSSKSASLWSEIICASRICSAVAWSKEAEDVKYEDKIDRQTKNACAWGCACWTLWQELGQWYLRPLLVLCLTLCLALCLLPAAPCSVPAHGRHHLQYIQITVFTKK